MPKSDIAESRGKENAPPLLLGVQTYTITMEIIMVVPQKVGINLIQNSAISLWWFECSWPP